MQVVKGTKSEIDNLYIELHHPTRKCNLSNKLCSVNVIVICVGENRSVGEALGQRKGSKLLKQTTILTGCHFSVKELVLAKRTAISARIETFEPCVTERVWLVGR